MLQNIVCLILVFNLVLNGCHGDEDPASQMILLRHIPHGLRAQDSYFFNIRSNFKGSVEFFESDRFQILVNVTSPTSDDLAKVHYNYTQHHDQVLLQLFEAERLPHPSPIPYILITIGGITLLALLFAVIFTCWWNIYKRPYIKETKIFNPDSSQAPLLDGKMVDKHGAPHKLKKRKKRKTSRTAESEDYASSEEDNLARQGHPTSPGQQAHGFKPSPKADRAHEVELSPALKHSRSPGGSPRMAGDMSTFGRGSNGDVGSDRPVVSYIKMQAGQQVDNHDPRFKRKSGQYVPLNSEGSGSDVEKQTTLKIQRDRGYQPAGTNAMPDVLRGRAHGMSPEAQGKHNNARYFPLSQSGGESASDSEYNPGRMSGQVPQIIDNKSHMSPQSGRQYYSPKDRELDQVELDSVGSSRSGESSRSSGARLYDSSYGSRGDRADSTDSAKSSSPSGTFPRADHPRQMQTGTLNNKYYLRSPDPVYTSPTNSSAYSSGSNGSPRMVDEAYGTMGSQDSGTLRSNSAASTGSGSSSSVVTVVAADDPNANTFGHRKVRGKPYSTMPRDISRGHEDHSNKTGADDDNPWQRQSGTFTGPRKHAAVPNKYVHMTIVATMTVVALIGGVYSHMITETEVHIKIYYPPGYIRNLSKVYLKHDKQVQRQVHLGSRPLDILWFDVKDARIRQPNISFCVNDRRTCAQGCDDNTGECICKHGYKLLENRRKCVDVNECEETPSKFCNTHADCHNTKGSYLCTCGPGFYGDGKICHTCHNPCPNGTYEVRSCSETHPKLCKECSKECDAEEHITGSCTEKGNIKCTVCNRRCSKDQFEFTPCHGTQDRRCMDVSKLKDPTASTNVIAENRRKSKLVRSHMVRQKDIPGPPRDLIRGQGFMIRVFLKEINLTPLFRAVDHSDSNDNEGFFGSDTVMKRYCPYPVPEKYQLSLFLSQDITTKAKYYNCDRKRRRSRDKCLTETGFYLNPREACHTYQTFGRLPALNPEGWGILCARPGVLSNKFGVSSDLMDMTTMFVDKTVNCAEQRLNCDSCTEGCARTMQSHTGAHQCNITAEDSDNGESPRLQYCHNCCAKRDCSEMCKVYKASECKPERCVTGNVAEFVLEPVFSSQNNKFACHIEPDPGYRIYNVDFEVHYHGQKIGRKTLTAKRVFDKVHPTVAVDKHHFLKVHYGSEVTAQPNMIEGTINNVKDKLNAGHYMPKGISVTDAMITARTLSVRPRKPFLVNTKMWKRQDCNTDALSKLVLAGTHPFSMNPYKPEPHIDVQFLKRGYYRLINRTMGPYLFFEVPRNESILRPLFGDTTVKDDETLKAEILRRKGQWTIRLVGEVLKCPGAFGVTVKDPKYPDWMLFNYDIAVNCPDNKFKLDFHIPTEGPDDYDKSFHVVIQDTFRAIKIVVFRAAPWISQEAYAGPVDYKFIEEKQMTIFTPVVAVLSVITGFLALLLVGGFITESAGKNMKKADNKVHSQHLLFVVCYVTFRGAYSVALTFTVLLLLIHYTSRESIDKMGEYDRFTQHADSMAKLEVDKIQEFVREEVQRQSSLANETKYQCERHLEGLHGLVEQAKENLTMDVNEERLVSQMATQYTRLMIMNLTNRVVNFKQHFGTYAKSSLDNLMRSLVQTSSALQNNKWVAAAKVIHKVVQDKRANKGLKSKPLMDWIGIHQEVEELSVDLSLKDFPLPNISDFLELKLPRLNYKKTAIPKTAEVTLPQNKWYFEGKRYQPEGMSRGGSMEGPAEIQHGSMLSWESLLAVIVIIDLLWFIHRMAKTYSTAKMILYGVPCYIDCKRYSEGTSPKKRGPNRSNNVAGRCCLFIKELNLRVMKTEFVPKLVATVTSCCAIYFVLAFCDEVLTARTLASLGYIDSLVAPVETSHELAKTRIKTNAYRINKFEYPFYEELINVRLKRYQLMLEMYQDLQRSNNRLHDAEYCVWKKMLNSGTPCDCSKVPKVKLSFTGCELPPVSPKAYTMHDLREFKEKLAQSALPYINAARQVVMDTSHLVLVFIALLVLVDILGAVTWIYLKRYLRVLPLYTVATTYPPYVRKPKQNPFRFYNGTSVM